MKFILLTLFFVATFFPQDTPEYPASIKKMYAITHYIKHDAQFINDSPTKDVICVNVQVRSDYVVLLSAFKDYLIDSVYYLRKNSKIMTKAIMSSYDSIMVYRRRHAFRDDLPAGTYFNNCIKPDYSATFDFYSDSICVVEVRRYPTIYVLPPEPGTNKMGKNYKYLFKTDPKGNIINVLKSFSSH